MFCGVCNIAYLYYQYALDAVERYFQWYTLLNLRAWHVKVKAKVAQSCATICDHTDYIVQGDCILEFSKPGYWSG